MGSTDTKESLADEFNAHARELVRQLVNKCPDDPVVDRQAKRVRTAISSTPLSLIDLGYKPILKHIDLISRVYDIEKDKYNWKEILITEFEVDDKDGASLLATVRDVFKRCEETERIKLYGVLMEIVDIVARYAEIMNARNRNKVR